MTPRIELTVYAGALAAVLAMLGAGFMVRGEAGILAVAALAAALAASLAAFWTAGWGLFLACPRRGWAATGLALAMVVVAMVLFVPCVALAWMLSPVGGGMSSLEEALNLGALFALFAVVLGGLPAWLLVLPMALRYLRRRSAPAPEPRA